MKKLFYLSIVFIGLLVFPISNVNAQGVGINPSGNNPDNSAGLDVDFTNKGLLIPRVVLQSAADASTVANPATSLLVYNLGTGGLTPEGYYYNAGTPAAPNWTKFVTGGGGSGWSLTGNGATTPGTNFVGTTDPTDVVFKTNGTENVRIKNGGNVGIATNSPNVAMDVNGALATRTTTATINSNGFALTVGNSSHIVFTSTNTIASTPWYFTLSNGQPGQYLVLELQGIGMAELQSSGNVRLASPIAGFFSSYATLSLKWDDINSAWIELARNAFVTSSFPITLSGSPPTSYNGKLAFGHVGANQNFTVPNYATQIFVKMWGAGSGGGSGGTRGASGAFVSGYLTVTPGSILTVIVGGGGIYATSTASAAGGFGGGGACGSSSANSGSGLGAGSGGGRSAIQITAGTDAATAGGAGGGSKPNQTDAYGGGGGGPDGSDGASSISAGTGKGRGGTTTTGGVASTGGAANSVAGSSKTGSAGGNSTYGGGGGGGGYFGGSGGSGNTAEDSAHPIGGGGGGSSYMDNLSSVTNIGGASNSSTATNSSDIDFTSGTSTGGGSYTNGGNGRVVIFW